MSLAIPKMVLLNHYDNFLCIYIEIFLLSNLSSVPQK